MQQYIDTTTNLKKVLSLLIQINCLIIHQIQNLNFELFVNK